MVCCGLSSHKECLVVVSDACSVIWRNLVSSVLPSIANEVLKSVVAQYNAIELIGKREAVSPALRLLRGCLLGCCPPDCASPRGLA